MKINPKQLANYPTQLDKDVVIGVQALAAGLAQPHQQKLVLDWIIDSACKTYDNPYRQDPYETAFASGRMFAGQQIVKHLNANTAIFDKPTNKGKL